MLLSDVAIRNRTTVGALIVLILVTGVYSYVTLPREAAPDVPIPLVLVTTSYEGVAPEDIESSVTLKIEKEMTGLKGMKEVRSTSAEGVSSVIIEFQPDVVIEDALQYVRARVDLAKPDLPDDADEPSIQEINIAEFPIMLVNLSGAISPVRLKALADDLEDEIEQVPGVLGVDVTGELEREIRIEIDPDRVASFGLTIPEIMSLIPSENVNISAGGLETPVTRFNVRVPAEFVEPGEVDSLVLTTRNGNPIYLTDVASVRDTFKDRVSYSRLDGKDSITLAVKKRVGANVVAISDAVKALLDKAKARLPLGTRVSVTYDVSKYIRDMVSDLENNILSGLVLVVLALFLFLGIRTSVIVATAIPLSMLISFAVIQALGYTLNMIVLFGLVLALGMLVDNAIVIVENIYRHLQLGYKRREAAMKGAAEVAWPVIASTATTIAAFAPMAFWPGIMGDFMKYLPITLVITLSSSLFVAIIVNPTICAVMAKAQPDDELGNKRRDGWFVGGYVRLLKLALRHRFVTLSLSVLLLAALVILYVRRGHGVEFFPLTDPDRAMIDIRSPQGTNIAESDRLARIAETRVEKYRKDLKNVVTNVGGGQADMFGGGSAGGPHVVNMTLVFYDYEVRKRPSADVLAEVRQRLSDVAGAEVKVEREKEGPPTGAAVTVRVIGKDLGVLDDLSEKARRLIRDVPGLVNLRSDLEATRPELVFRVDRRRAMLLGVNTAVIGNFLKTAVFGTEVGTYRQFNDEYDITVRLPLSHRVNIDDLFRLQVPNARGQAIALSSLGEFDYKGGFGTINRVDQKRVVTLTGDAEGRLSTAVLADVQERLAKLDLPPGYAVRYAGEKEEQDKAKRFLLKAFVLALLLIVTILVANFNSLTVPFIIMTTVVLSLVGVLAGLIVCGLPFGIVMTGIGVISLAGVVVNNAIVLLDYTRRLQRRGLALLDAALEAGKTRLRPVLLTAATTILGLIPMATGVSYDFHVMSWATKSMSSQWWRGMAVAVIFGLAFATVLTLVVVPTLYVSIYRVAAWMGLGDLRKNGDGEERA